VESARQSVRRLWSHTAREFVSDFPFLAAVALVVVLPGKLLLQFLLYLADVPPEGIAAYFLFYLSDLLLGALVAPATIYGLTAKLDQGKLPPLSECLGAGLRLWRRMFWNLIKVEITVGLWSLLLFVPGIIMMVRLSLTDPVAALEISEPDPLARSRELTEGHRLRIFLVLLPLGILGLAGTYLAFRWVGWSNYSRWVIALSDSLYAVGTQVAIVAMLLIYRERKAALR
jgi:uncharacterized membrane protein